MHATLFVPARFDAAAGPRSYHRRIVAGLRAAGHAVRTCALPGCHAPADATATQAAQDALAALPAETVPVIDGLALPAFAGLMQALAARNAVALIHQPTPPDTGADADAADQAAPPGAARHMLPRFARIIATSTAIAASLANDCGVDPDRVAVVVPGTDDAPRAIGSVGPGCHILSIGALVPRNGHDLLLRALGRLFDLDWRLTIAGDPTRDAPHAQTLATLAQASGVAARVRFAGAVDDAALATLWHGADLFALAASADSDGMAIADALKRGVPVAVTQGNAADALVTAACGVVCPADDRDQLSKALRRLIFGAALRHDMADAAWCVGRTLPDWTAQATAFAAALDFARAP